MQLRPVAEDLHPANEAAVERWCHPAGPTVAATLPRGLSFSRLQGSKLGMIGVHLA